MLSSGFVEHAAIGLAFAVLSLFFLAFAVIAVVLISVTNNCWWNCDTEGDPLIEDYGQYFKDADDEESQVRIPIDTVLGTTPKNAEIV